MANYYFLATLLPPLKVGSPPEIGSRELEFLLKQNLTEADFAKVTVLRRLTDIENIRSIWRKESIVIGGNFDQQELEDRLFFREGLPSYVIEFIETYPENDERLQHFPQLLHRFFEVEIKEQTGFLDRYLLFEWQWRLIFVVLRAKALGRDLEMELQYEDPENPFVAQLLAQKEANVLHLPPPYTALKELFETRKQAPLDLYHALSEWRFTQIEEMVEWDYFSIERILGYYTQLEIVEQWLELDKRKGLEIVEQMMDEKQ